MRRRKAKDELFVALATGAKALANGRRAEIVDVLSQGERSVDDLAAEIGQSWPVPVSWQVAAPGLESSTGWPACV